MCESAHPTRHPRAVLLPNFVTEKDGQEAVQYWAAYLGVQGKPLNTFGCLGSWAALIPTNPNLNPKPCVHPASNNVGLSRGDR